MSPEFRAPPGSLSASISLLYEFLEWISPTPWLLECPLQRHNLPCPATLMSNLEWSSGYGRDTASWHLGDAEMAGRAAGHESAVQHHQRASIVPLWVPVRCENIWRMSIRDTLSHTQHRKDINLSENQKWPLCEIGDVERSHSSCRVRLSMTRWQLGSSKNQ